MEEVLSVEVQRDLLAVAVVLGCQEEPDDHVLRSVAVDIHSYAEHFVVEARALDNHALVVEDFVAWNGRIETLLKIFWYFAKVINVYFQLLSEAVPSG